jgi:hypothetical protein
VLAFDDVDVHALARSLARVPELWLGKIGDVLRRVEEEVATGPSGLFVRALEAGQSQWAELSPAWRKRKANAGLDSRKFVATGAALDAMMMSGAPGRRRRLRKNVGRVGIWLRSIDGGRGNAYDALQAGFTTRNGAQREGMPVVVPTREDRAEALRVLEAELVKVLRDAGLK